VSRHPSGIYLFAMAGKRDAAAPKLRLVSATDVRLPPEQTAPAGFSGLLAAARRWLRTGRWQAHLQCRRAGHLPARTATGTRCQRCGAHWEHL
jgi:hypothetical protein